MKLEPSKLEKPAKILLSVGGDVERLDGYIIKESEELLFYARYVNWNFSGIVIAKRDYVQIDSEADESVSNFFQSVLSEIGEPVTLPNGLDGVSTMRDAVEFAAKLRCLVVLEGLEEDAFDIARILAVSDKCAMAEFLEADGTFEKGNDWFKIRNVVCLTMLDPYCLGIEKFHSTGSS